MHMYGIFSWKRIQIGSGAYPASYLMDIFVTFLPEKATKTWRPFSLTCAEVYNTCSVNFSRSHTFTSWCFAQMHSFLLAFIFLLLYEVRIRLVISIFHKQNIIMSDCLMITDGRTWIS